MDIELLKRKFSIEMVSGKDLSKRCCMCNAAFVDHVYEEIILSSVQDEGFFAMILKHEDKDVAECIFHFVSSSKVSIDLLCSAKNSVGAATMLFCSLLEKLKAHGCKIVTLNVSRDAINKHAIAFYQKFGFTHLTSNTYTLNLDAYPQSCNFVKEPAKKRTRRSTSTNTTMSSSDTRNNKNKRAQLGSE